MNAASLSATWHEVALIGGVLTMLAVPLIWVWRDSRDGIRGLHKRLDALKDESVKQAENLANYKLEAAEKFVSTEAIARVESRLVISEERVMDALDRMNQRLDRVLETRTRGRTP